MKITHKEVVTPPASPKRKGPEVQVRTDADLKCPACEEVWELDESAKETVSTVMNLCQVKESLIQCACKRVYVIFPKGKNAVRTKESVVIVEPPDGGIFFAELDES